ncbi:MAG: FHA domain-containing protein [Alphaproteobacteria bacterium]|nr:FHA domain-containing protein [Alphaproteobacteria bacterium]
MIELTISRAGEADRRMLLKGGAYSLGRHADNDIVLDDKAVSRRHARLLVDGDVAMLEDLGSGSGSFVGGRAVGERRLQDGDEVEIVPFVLRVRAGAKPPTHVVDVLEVVEGADAGRVFDLIEDELTIGRGDDQDLKLDDHGASRGHALLARRRGTWFVRDLDSANGTYVNDQRVAEAPLEQGDRLGVGESVLVLGQQERQGAGPSAAASGASTPDLPAGAPVVERVAVPARPPAPPPPAAPPTPRPPVVAPPPPAPPPQVPAPAPPAAAVAPAPQAVAPAAPNVLPWLLVGMLVILLFLGGVVVTASAP